MTLKIWLSLTLAVVLAHLALLQALPLNPPVTNAPVSPIIATQTVVLSRSPAAGRTQVAAAQQDKAKQPLTQAPKPTSLTQRTSEAAVSSTNPTPVASVAPDATKPQEQPTADSPAEAASAPAPVASTPASAPEGDAAPASAVVASAPDPEAGRSIPPIDVAFDAERLPTSVKLMYRVEANKFPYTLSSELIWQLQEQRYQAQLSISTFGQTRVQTSRGQIDEFGLAPERFSDKYRSEVAAHFNRTQGLVSFSANTPSIPLQPGAQDRLSVLIQLAALVASAPQKFSPGTTLQVQTIGPRDADLWLFTFGSFETLELPGGPQQGLKLVRQPRQTYDQKLEVWLAPGLAYLPARIRITEANGNYVDQKWASSEAGNNP